MGGGGGTPLSTSQALSVPAYVRAKAQNPGRKIEFTRARMMVKSPDVKLEIRFSTWNVGSMSEKSNEISETLKRSCVDICCLQEVGRKGQGAKMSIWKKLMNVENGVIALVLVR